MGSTLIDILFIHNNPSGTPKLSIPQNDTLSNKLSEDKNWYAAIKKGISKSNENEPLSVVAGV